MVGAGCCRSKSLCFARGPHYYYYSSSLIVVFFIITIYEVSSSRSISLWGQRCRLTQSWHADGWSGRVGVGEGRHTSVRAIYGQCPGTEVQLFDWTCTTQERHPTQWLVCPLLCPSLIESVMIDSRASTLPSQWKIPLWGITALSFNLVSLDWQPLCSHWIWPLLDLWRKHFTHVCLSTYSFKSVTTFFLPATGWLLHCRTFNTVDHYSE